MNIREKLWTSNERSCLHFLQHKTTTKTTLLEIHAFMLRNSLDNNKNLIAKFIATCSSIAVKQLSRSIYDANSLISHARQLFDKMPEKTDTFICNTMMGSHLGIRQFDECLSLYKDLKRDIEFKPDGYTFLTLARLCSLSLNSVLSQQIHGVFVKEGFGNNVYVSTSLVDMYAKLGQMKCTKKLFDEMSEKTAVSWTALVCGYAKCGEIDNARTFFDQTPKKDTAIFNAMLNAYIKIGDMTNASRLFNEMPEKNVVSWTTMVNGYCTQGNVLLARNLFDAMPNKNLISWNSMIKGYYQNKQPNDALRLFNELQTVKSFEPDNVTIVSVLPAIADMGALDLGNWVHEFVLRKKMNTAVNVSTALVDMYAKCGEFEKARKVFDSMVEKETATWNALIHGLAVNGHGNEAINLFLDMEKTGVKPNEVTMTAVLSACNHSGLVEQGLKWFNSMQDFGIPKKIEHFGCVIDLLGRCGRLNEAEKIMNTMPYAINDIILSSFLSSCGYVNDIERAERVLRGFGEDGNYVMLRNLYARGKRWGEVEGVYERMRGGKAGKEVGGSVVEAGGRGEGFRSGDRGHPEWARLSWELEKLVVHMKKGYGLEDLDV